MDGESRLTIGAIARLYSVTLRTLRFYEQRGLLTPSRIGPARYYSENDEVRLQVILQAKRLGFTLVEIARIIESRDTSLDPSAEVTCVLSRSQIAAQIAILVQRRDTTETAIRELHAVLTEQRVARSL